MVKISHHNTYCEQTEDDFEPNRFFYKIGHCKYSHLNQPCTVRMCETNKW